MGGTLLVTGVGWVEHFWEWIGWNSLSSKVEELVGWNSKCWDLVGWNSKGADLVMWIFQQWDVGGIDCPDLDGSKLGDLACAELRGVVGMSEEVRCSRGWIDKGGSELVELLRVWMWLGGTPKYLGKPEGRDLDGRNSWVGGIPKGSIWVKI